MNQPKKDEHDRAKQEAHRLPLWLSGFAHHFGDIALSTFVLMKTPISWLLAAIFTVTMYTYVLGHIFGAEQTHLVGFCELPLVSLLPACAVEHGITKYTPPTVGSDFSRLMEIQHRALRELTSVAPSSGTDLVLNIRHAELAVRDLVGLARSSDLASKDILADALSDFLTDARQASRGLQMLTSKIHGTMDSILAFNRYVLQAIETARISAKAGNPEDLDIVVLRTFHSSFTWFTSTISEIIVDAVPVSSQLDLLEERLVTVHALALREDFDNALALDDLLWQLWSRVGGNRQKRRDLENRASLLKNVQQYRSVAAAYVTGAIHTLTSIDAELSELRDRLNAPSLEGNAIPVAVQLDGIERSVRRMKEGSSGSHGVHLSLSHGVGMTVHEDNEKN